MRLFCPNCQQQSVMGDESAGRMVKCPHCGHEFLAPALFGVPATITEAAPSVSTNGQASESIPVAPPISLPRDVVPPVPPSPPATPPDPSPTSTSTTTSTDSTPPPLTRTLTIRLNQEILEWATPGLLVFIFLLTFLPWNGAFPAGYGVYTQSAWSALVGNVTIDNAGNKELKLKEYLEKSTTIAAWLWVYLPVTFLAMVVAIASVVVPRLRVDLPDPVKGYWPIRRQLLGGLCLLALLLLLIQTGSGFGLENAIYARVDQPDPDRPDKTFMHKLKAADSSDEDRLLARIQRARELDFYQVGETLALRLAIFGHFLVLVCLAGESWLIQRGSRPAPQIIVEY